MRHLLGAEANFETILTLTAPYREAAAPPDAPALRDALRRYLDALQPGVPRAGGAEVAFRTGTDATAVLADAFGASEDVAPLTGAALTDVLARHRQATACVGAEDGLEALFRICTDSVVSSAEATAPASMTSGSALGILWINPRPAWTTDDLVEAYVHELTHTLLTLDEHRYGHYRSYEQLDDPACFAISAILRRPRPLNLVFHSLVVATELLALRAAMPGHDGPFHLHGNTADVTEQAEATLASVQGMPGLEKLTTPRFRHLLDRVAAQLTGADLAITQT